MISGSVVLLLLVSFGVKTTGLGLFITQEPGKISSERKQCHMTPYCVCVDGPGAHYFGAFLQKVEESIHVIKAKHFTIIKHVTFTAVGFAIQNGGGKVAVI